MSETEVPKCPSCEAEFSYQDGQMWICPSCSHEWSINANSEEASSGEKVYKDAHGNVLVDGDSITVIKDLKIKGSSEVVKVGTKVKGIRLIDSGNGHDIDCKIKGIGAIQLKSEFVKKI